MSDMIQAGDKVWFTKRCEPVSLIGVVTDFNERTQLYHVQGIPARVYPGAWFSEDELIVASEPETSLWVLEVASQELKSAWLALEAVRLDRAILGGDR